MQLVVVTPVVIYFHIVNDALSLHFKLDNFALNFLVNLLDDASDQFFTIELCQFAVTVVLLKFTDALVRCEDLVAIHQSEVHDAVVVIGVGVDL